jgi:riboflavin biosynthesis pyrimidine reductase
MPRDNLLEPLQALRIDKRGTELKLPGRLARLYGRFWLPPPRSPAHFSSNFVTTLDGVVSLRVAKHANGGDISGFSIQDRMVMGLVRALADAVIVGSGTLAADRTHVWTPEAICPELAREYALIRKALGKAVTPLNVVVSGSGSLNLRLPVFSSGTTRVLIVTTTAGSRRLAGQKIPQSVEVRTLRQRSKELAANAIADEVCKTGGIDRVLVEGGPRLLADFYTQRLIASQFLTLAPQIAGRVEGDHRPGMVMGKVFAPRHPLWGTLTDVRLGSRNLFLRYSFPPIKRNSKDRAP